MKTILFVLSTTVLVGLAFSAEAQQVTASGCAGAGPKTGSGDLWHRNR